MVNPKQLREFFMQILNNIERHQQSRQSLQTLAEQVKTLDEFIVKNYNDIIKLPQYSKNAVLKIHNENKNLEILLYRYNTCLLYNMNEEANKELQEIYLYVKKLKEIYFLSKRNKNIDIRTSIDEMMSFIKPHMALVGEAQVVKDIQRGLSLLNKNRRQSPIEAKNILKQDGVCGHKTIACICDVCRNYTPKVIKKYIKKGIMNNIIFDTKNNQNIDTKKLTRGILLNLTKGER